MLSFVLRDLSRNPRRSFAAAVGVTLGVGLFSGLLFFIDASGATMTQRAIAPIALDVQAVLGSPLGLRLRFDERVSARSPIATGEAATFTLTIVNPTADPVHEVVVNDEPPPPFSYVPASTTLDGAPVADRGGQSPLAQGLARSGLNIGTVAPRTERMLTYRAHASRIIPTTETVLPVGTVSSREDVVPVRANAPSPLTFEQIRTRIAQVPGVDSADGLSFVDLPAGSLAGNGVTLDGPVRVFAFDRAYQQHHPSIRVVRGSFGPGRILASAEAARALGASPGDVLVLRAPDASDPLRLPVGGIADLTAAEALFTSRKASKLDEVLYVPYSVIVPPATFADTIIPAFRAASAAQGTILKNLPVVEVDVRVDRGRLRSEPAAALAQTTAVARAIRRIAPGQVALIDNISNTLEVARGDAVVGKRMFLFLGLPGMLLAASLAVLGANIHADAQRREQATLRLHGADRGHLLRMLALKSFVLAGAAAVVGAGIGLLSAEAVLGHGPVGEVHRRDVATSAITAVVAGVALTAGALHVRGRRSLRLDVGEGRRELAVPVRPSWHRLHLDVVLLVAAAMVVALDVVAPAASAVSVSNGRSASLPTRLLFPPLAIWLGGTLATVRVFEAMTSRLALPRAPRFGPLLWGTLSRNLRRRSWSLATATAGVGLVVAFATNLAVFETSYDAAKRADSRFVVGSDLRILPGAESDRPHPPGYASALMVAGVAAVAPVVFRLENSVLIGPFDQDRTDLAAIEPASFRRVAALSYSSFAGLSPTAAMDALERNHQGLLVRASKADDLSIEVGDRVQVLLARGTKRQTLRSFRVVGLFETFPGFPQGIDLVANLSTYRAATKLAAIDFFLARTSDSTSEGLARAVTALRSGPGRNDPLRIETTATTLNKDQSSLTAVNVHGLLDLGRYYGMAMSAAAIAMFVLGLQMQRRREYLTLRALGLATSRMFVLVLGEAASVAASGLVAGYAVGITTAKVFVKVLRPLFILEPPTAISLPRLCTIGAVLLGATVATAAVATVMLRRLAATTILRDP